MNDSSENELDILRKENERLHQVLSVNQIITASLNLEFVLDTLMDKAKEVVDAEASSLMLLDEETDELYFYTVKGEKSELLKTLRLKLGEGISGWVAREGKAVLIEDCSKDPRFFKKADEMSDFVTKTMMCVPLKVGKKILGTVQVLNKKNNQFFDAKDLQIFEITSDQAAIAIENARLHKMATIDGMTGLYLKHYFLARLSEEYKRAKNKNIPVSLIMSDIDFFRNVNNNYGHQGGDAALVALAEVIRETVIDFGEDCIPGRYGGEEFCVLLPETDADRALELAERIRKNVESKKIIIDGQEVKITISVGASSYPVHKDLIHDPEDFVKLADEALYICKDKGRNCVALYERKQ